VNAFYPILVIFAGIIVILKSRDIETDKVVDQGKLKTYVANRDKCKELMLIVESRESEPIQPERADYMAGFLCPALQDGHLNSPQFANLNSAQREVLQARLKMYPKLWLYTRHLDIASVVFELTVEELMAIGRDPVHKALVTFSRWVVRQVNEFVADTVVNVHDFSNLVLFVNTHFLQTLAYLGVHVYLCLNMGNNGSRLLYLLLNCYSLYISSYLTFNVHIVSVVIAGAIAVFNDFAPAARIRR
jgi:hypothetical protein